MRKILNRLVVSSAMGFAALGGIIPLATLIAAPQIKANAILKEKAQDNIDYLRYVHNDPVADAYAIGAPALALDTDLDAIYQDASAHNELTTYAAGESANVAKLMYQFFYQDTDHSNQTGAPLFTMVNDGDDSAFYNDETQGINMFMVPGYYDDGHDPANECDYVDEFGDRSCNPSDDAEDGAMTSVATFHAFPNYADRMEVDQAIFDSFTQAVLGSMFADVFFTDINMDELNWFRNVLIPATFNDQFHTIIQYAEGTLNLNDYSKNMREGQKLLPWSQSFYDTESNDYITYQHVIMYAFADAIGKKDTTDPLIPNNPTPCVQDATQCTMDSLNTRQSHEQTRIRFDHLSGDDSIWHAGANVLAYVDWHTVSGPGVPNPEVLPFHLQNPYGEIARDTIMGRIYGNTVDMYDTDFANFNVTDDLWGARYLWTINAPVEYPLDSYYNDISGRMDDVDTKAWHFLDGIDPDRLHMTNEQYIEEASIMPYSGGHHMDNTNSDLYRFAFVGTNFNFQTGN